MYQTPGQKTAQDAAKPIPSKSRSGIAWRPSPSLEAEPTEAERLQQLAAEIDQLPREAYLDQVKMLETELDRTHGMIRYLDGKPSTLIVVAGGLSGSIILKAMTDAHGDVVFRAAMAVALCLLAIAGINGFRVMFPRLSLTGWRLGSLPHKPADGVLSPHYFGHVAQFETPDRFLRRVTETSENRFERSMELAKQIHINARIAVVKSRLIGLSVMALEAAIAVALTGWAWHAWHR